MNDTELDEMLNQWDAPAVRAELREKVCEAYQVTAVRDGSRPQEFASARFDVETKPASRADRDQLPPMLQALLADRFRLTLHRETRQVDVYVRRIGKSAPKLKPGTNTPSLDRIGRNWDLAQLARYLTYLGSDRPVMDETGLTGSFNFDIDIGKIAMEASDGQTAEPTLVVRMFDATVDAIQDPGLKLLPEKAPIEVLVIDHAERPGAN